jgi:SAM-dependent methyltransferase
MIDQYSLQGDPGLPADMFRHAGTCPACEKPVTFVAADPYFRSALKCDHCGSVPRHRVLMKTISDYFPNWRDLEIHESSPGWDMVSQRLANECKGYVASQYDSSAAPGQFVDAPRMPCRRYRSENLELQTFADARFDLVIAQDVFEHIFRPDLAIKEIARTLKPNGAIFMTVPILMKRNPSRIRARQYNGIIEYVMERHFHGNPLNSAGSLVTIDWGYDIVSYLQHHSGLSFLMIQLDNIDLGIRADLNEVLVGWKIPMLDLT